MQAAVDFTCSSVIVRSAYIAIGCTGLLGTVLAGLHCEILKQVAVVCPCLSM